VMVGEKGTCNLGYGNEGEGDTCTELLYCISSASVLGKKESKKQEARIYFTPHKFLLYLEYEISNISYHLFHLL
jgi:hypothetical protein